MNSVSFTPSVSAYSAVRNSSNYQNRPAFTGLAKPPKPAQAKEAVNFAQKLYSTLFVPSGENVLKMTDSAVLTEAKPKGAVRLIKKYNKWSRQPAEIVKMNTKTKINERYMVNKQGGYDIEFHDVHTPDYKIAVGYKDLKSKEFTFGAYDGPVTIKYGEKTIEIPKEQREALIKNFDEVVDARYSDDFDALLKHRESVDFQALSDRFYQDSDVIASALLKSPKYAQEQLSTISTSMPYGIERILEKIEK